MISVCLIVKNEEKYIEDCLQSVQHIASEIIVVDNGCTDRTVDIVKNYGCKIINAPTADLDMGRALYLKEAKYPWILIIDADERMEMIRKEYLYNILLNTDDDVLAYNLKSFQYIGKGKWADAELIRLFRNNRNIHYNNSSIHATLEPSILSQNGKIKTLEWYMHHIDILQPNRTSRKRELYKYKLIKQLSNIEFRKNDPNSFYLYHIFLGMEYVAAGEYENADKCFFVAAKNENMFQEYANNSRYRSLILQNRYDEIPNLIDLSNTTFIKDIDFYDRIDIMANVYVEKDIKLAILLYEKVLNSNIARPSDYINLAYLIKNNDRTRAKQLLEKAIELNSFLQKSIIYCPGDEPNMFSQVSCFLKQIENVKDLFLEFNLLDF